MRIRRFVGRMTAVCAGMALAFTLAPVTTGAAFAADGSGPRPAGYETTLRLRGHTIYRPNTIPANAKLPIVAWGNGGCMANGTMFENILTEFASHGFLVIANGRPGGIGRTNADQLIEAVDWAIAENNRLFSKYRNRIDTTRIAVMGQSCGGLETYQVADDPRITTTVLWNSGLLNDADNYQLVRLHAPIAYFVGGPGDIAYPNAMDDWNGLPTGLPAFMGNLDVGHRGTFAEPNGGEFGRVGVAWLKWQLKNDATAGQQFVGDNCGLCSTDWEIRQKNLS